MSRAPWILAAAILLVADTARAGDVLTVLDVVVDPPTLHTLGVQVLIADDDDRDATVGVRVRELGASAWQDALPLLRVRPETVFVSVPQQFAGSVFDREPATDYEVELHLLDPDGVDTTMVVMAGTRPLPADPQAPVDVPVADVPALQAALAAAQPGHVITLAPGSYAGSFFTINASGTAADPIVLRGTDAATTILDGEGCGGCNILEVYGSHVRVEHLTFTAGERAIRFQGATTGNAVRHVTITDVVHGIGSNTGQSSFYICDNDLTGRLVWPWTFDPDASTHWDDRGVDVTGDGHVVCHNRMRGFGDPVVNKQVQARGWDVYGNDIYDSYDGTELDESEGNARLYLNRWTNVMDPVSIQPSHGGPLYVLRNVVLNAPEEPIKLKSLGGTQEPSGVLVYHNTFVSPNLALNLQTPITQHNFVIANNLFIGPEQLAGRAVEWTAALDGAEFNYNGYWPDGGFWLGVLEGMNQVFDNFAALQASGVFESDGVLLTRPIFAADFVGPADAMTHQEPADFALAPASAALDRGLSLPGVNALAPGGPDLGARELGCPAPTYGPRPVGQDGVIARIDCSADDDPDTTTSDTTGDTDAPDDTTATVTVSATDDPPGTSNPDPTEPAPTDGGDSAPPPDTTTGGVVATVATTPETPDDDASGCACRTAAAPPLLALLGPLLVRRRRR